MSYSLRYGVSNKIKNLQTRLTNLTMATMFAITSLSGVAPLFITGTAHADAPVNGIVINEFSSYTSSDWVELYNTTDSNVSLNGWKLEDSSNTNPNIANLSGSLAGKAFLQVDVGDRLNQDGDVITLIHDTNHQTSVAYGNAANPVVGAPGDGQVAARTTDGGNTWQLTTNATPGATNDPADTTDPAINSTTPANHDTISGNAYIVSANITDNVSSGNDITASYSVKANYDYPFSGSKDVGSLQNQPLTYSGNNQTYTVTLNANGLPNTVHYQCNAYIGPTCISWQNSNVTSYTFTFTAKDAAGNTATKSVTATKGSTPASSASVTGQDFDTWDNSGNGFKGINIGFKTENFTHVSSITVTLKKGGSDLVTNTSSAALIDDINNQKDSFGQNGSLSTVFVVSGTNNDTWCQGGPCWNAGNHAWTANDQPDTALVTVIGTDQSGNVTKTTTLTNFTEPNGVSFASLLPADTTPPSVPALLSPVDRGYSKTNNFYFDWADSTDNSGQSVTYEFQSSTNPHTASGVLDTNLWHSQTLTSSTIHSVGAHDGTWYWQVRAIDAAGNKSAWTPVWHMTIDTHAPAGVISTPSVNGYVNTRQTGNILTVKGTSTDNLGLNRVLVQLLTSKHGAIQNKTIHLSGTSDDWQATFNTNNLHLADGKYAVIASFDDNAGNVYKTDYVDFTLDNTKPVAKFTSATDNPNPNGYYNGDFQVGYDVSDNYMLKSVNVSLFDTDSSHTNHYAANCYGKSNESADDDSGTCSVHLGSLPDGKYYVAIQGQDAAGLWTVAATRTVYIQHSVPAAPTSPFFKFQYDSGDITNPYLYYTTKSGGNNLLMGWKAPIGWVTGYQIQTVYPNGDRYNLNYDGHGGTNPWAWINWNFGKHGQGAYIYSARAQNPNGWGPWSNTATLYYDTESPTGYFTDSSYNHKETPAQYVNGNFWVYGVASDNVALHDAFFDVRDANGAAAGCVPGTFSSSAPIDGATSVKIKCQINTANLKDGQTYTLRIHASDKTQHYGGGQNTPITIDRDAPTATLSLPDGSLYGKNVLQSIRVMGDLYDNSGHFHYVVHLLDANGNEVPITQQPGALTSNTTNGEVRGFTTANLGDGDYSVYIVITDAAGNSTTSNTVKFTVDNTAPALTTAVDLSHAKGPLTSAAMNGDNNGELTLRVYTDEPIDTASSTVKFHDSATGTDYSLSHYKSDKSANGKYLYFFNLPLDVAGFKDTTTKVNLSFHLCDSLSNCRDFLYNRSNDASKGVYVLTIDNVKPSVAATMSSTTISSQTTTEPTVTINATDADSGIDYVQYKVMDASNNTVLGWVKIDNKVATPVTGILGLGDGSYTLRARAFDKAGNKHSGTDVAFTVDKTAPDITPTTIGTADTGYYTVHGNTITPNFTNNDTDTTGYGYSWAADPGNPGSATFDSGVLNPTFTVTTYGDYTFTLTAKDALGNATTATFSFSYDAPQNSGGQGGSSGSSGSSDGQGAGNGSNNSGSNGTFSNVNGHVLGDSTTTPNNIVDTADKAVKGDSTTKLGTDSKDKTVDNSGAWLGLGWWWLLVLAAILAGWWFIAGARRRNDDNAKA